MRCHGFVAITFLFPLVDDEILFEFFPLFGLVSWYFGYDFYSFFASLLILNSLDNIGILFPKYSNKEKDLNKFIPFRNDKPMLGHLLLPPLNKILLKDAKNRIKSKKLLQLLTIHPIFQTKRTLIILATLHTLLMIDDPLLRKIKLHA
jgi:hypothetical protein